MRLVSNGRGLPPRIDASTVAAWLMLETSLDPEAEQYVAGGAPRLSQLGAITEPIAVTGLIGYARRFSGSGILAATASSDEIAAMQGDWTMSQWIRLDSYPAAYFFTGGMAGPIDSGAAADNVQGVVGVLQGRPCVYWEGASGALESAPASEILPLGQWTLITARKTVTGGGSTASLNILVNGRVVHSVTGLPNATDGSSGKVRWVIGGTFTNALASIYGLDGEAGPLIVNAAILSDEEVVDQFLRGASLATPYQTHLRVQIKDGTGTYRDVSEGGFYGFDFLEEVVMSNSVDDDTASAQVTLTRENGEISLAPLKGDSPLNNPTLAGSYSPRIDGWRQIQVRDSRIPLFLPFSTSGYFVAFEGRIDDVDDSQNEKIALSCRDEAARAAERWIDDEVIYPQSFGGGGCGGSAQAREIVLQEIIDDNGALFTLRVPVPTTSCMLIMQQPIPRSHLLPTLRALANEIGWDLRWAYNPETFGWALTLFEPQRSRIGVDTVIAARAVESSPGGSQQTARVRNSWTVTYPNSATVDGEGNRLPGFITVTDATSISDYDLRAAEVVEDASSQIDTSTEATLMAAGALADTKDPKRDAGKVIAFDSRIQPNDIIIVQPNGLSTTVDQIGAALSIESRWNPRSGSRTTVQCEGAPVAGYNRWLSIEAGRNGRPPIRQPGEALTGRGIGTLLPGLLDMVDRSIYLGGQKFIEVKNGDFARFSRGTAFPPDSFDMAAGTWGTGISAVAGTQLSGGFGVSITSTTPQLRSQAIPLIGDVDTPYGVECIWQRTSGNDFVQVDLQWLDASRAVVSTTSLYPAGPVNGYVGVDNFKAVPASTSTWFNSRAEGIVPPSGARFVRVIVRGRASGGFSPIVVDSVQMFRAARKTKTGWTNNAVSRPAWINFINPGVAGIAIGNIKNITFLDIISQATIANGDVYDVFRGQQDGLVAPTTFGAYYLVKEDLKLRIRAKIWWGTGGGIAVGQPIGFEIVKNGTYNTANGSRTGGTVILSNRFAKYAGVAGVAANFTTLEHEAFFVKGDRITIDARNDAAAGVLQLAFGSPVGGVQDYTYLSIDTRVAD